MNCGHPCFEIGGPFIAEDPTCPVHGSGATLKFEAQHIEVFMGGEFTLDNYSTVRAFRAALRAWDRELAGWGDDQQIAEVCVHQGKIQVTLKGGIPR